MPYRPSVNSLLIFGAYAVNTIFTYLSNTGVYGCTNAGQSNKYMTPITPPGWAFAIWGVIFLWEAVACVAALFPSQQKSPITNNKWFVYSWVAVCLSQSAWSIAFCQNVALSSVLLWCVFFSLLALQLSSTQSLQTAYGASHSYKEAIVAYLLYIAPFSLHLGWVTAATTLNVVIAFIAAVSSEVTILTASTLSVVFVMMVAMWISVLKRDVLHGCGVMWALNAVSHHDTTLKITTSTGLVSLPDTVASVLAHTALSGVYIVGALMCASYVAWFIQRRWFNVATVADESSQFPHTGELEGKLIEGDEHPTLQATA